MSANFFKNGNKTYIYMNTIWRKKNNSFGAPLTRPYFQNPKASYSRFPERKLKNIDVSAPIATKGFSRFGSIFESRVIRWYLSMLKTRPVLTKCITSSAIYTLADLSSQTITRSSSKPYDIMRTFRVGGYGLIVVGPALHLWYNFLSRFVPKRDLISTFKKMFMGKTMFGPFMTALFFSVNAAIQGESGLEIVARLKRDMLPAIINGIFYWPFCDFIIFRFVPVHLQPLASNSFQYIWTIYLTYMASLEKASTN